MKNSWYYLNQYVGTPVKPFLSRFILEGINQINLDVQKTPNLEVLTQQVYERTGWELKRAYGEVKTEEFFTMLSKKQFPLVFELRPPSSLFASDQPDLWHEIFGHITALSHEEIRTLYQELGRKAVAALHNDDSIGLQQITKYYWYICEYGLMEEKGMPKILGAGLAASPLGRFKIHNSNVTLFSLEQLADFEFNPYRYQNSLLLLKNFKEIEYLLL